MLLVGPEKSRDDQLYVTSFPSPLEGRHVDRLPWTDLLRKVPESGPSSVQDDGGVLVTEEEETGGQKTEGGKTFVSKYLSGVTPSTTLHLVTILDGKFQSI